MGGGGGRRDNYGGDVFWGCEHAGCCRIGEGVCVCVGRGVGGGGMYQIMQGVYLQGRVGL